MCSPYQAHGGYTQVTYPLDTLRLRIAVDPSMRSIRGASAALFREGSYNAFFRGLTASLIGNSDLQLGHQKQTEGAYTICERSGVQAHTALTAVTQLVVLLCSLDATAMLFSTATKLRVVALVSGRAALTGHYWELWKPLRPLNVS